MPSAWEACPFQIHEKKRFLHIKVTLEPSLPSAIKGNAVTTFTGKWVRLENIVLGEEPEAQKDKHIFSLTS